MIPPMLNTYEIDWPSSHFEPWLLNNRWPCVSEPILKAAPAHLKHVIECEAVMLARDVAAARTSWTPFRERLEDLGENLGLDRTELRGLLNDAYLAGVRQPTSWATLARSWLHVQRYDTFFFLKGATELARDLFDRVHRWANSDSFCETSDFLLQHGFIASVAELTFDPGEPIGFFERHNQLCLNASPHASLRPVALSETE